MNDADALVRLAAAKAALGPLGGLAVVALGYATVDLDQAEADLNPTSAPSGVRPAADDALLGARCRLVVTRSGPWIVLLEPSTEGRLAASLARWGQGPAIEYLATAAAVASDAAGGLAVSRPAPGPLGMSRLVLGGPPWGPHFIIVDGDPGPAPEPPPGTIEP